MNVIKPPTPITSNLNPVTVFTAGSIDMGKAEDWQADFEEYFKHQDVTLFNPRRDNWDPNWVQSISNPVFAEQVNWELDGLEQADIIALYLGETTTSIISMMELGMFASSGKVIVYCHDNFWRRGNVEVCADRHFVEVTNDIQRWYQRISERINYHYVKRMT